MVIIFNIVTLCKTNGVRIFGITLKQIIHSSKILNQVKFTKNLDSMFVIIQKQNYQIAQNSIYMIINNYYECVMTPLHTLVWQGCQLKFPVYWSKTLN